jgi:cytochrome c biogenesis protein CcdA
MSQSDEAAADPVLRRRGLLLASDALLIAVLCVLGAVHHPHWRWALVFWGLAIGVIGLALTELQVFIALRTLDVPDSRREIVRRRRSINVVNALTLGLTLGIFSAVAGTAAIDVFGAAVMLVSLVFGVLLTMRIVRQRRRSAR